MWRKQSWRLAVLGACCVGVGAATWSVNAADEMGGDTGASAMPSQEEMMAAYAKYAATGDAHILLARMEGTFNAECVDYLDPSGEPKTTKGLQVNRMILDGRFLENMFKGEMMGQPYKGFGLTGYDMVKKQFINIWADTMGTSWITSAGESDEKGTQVTLVGSYDNPVLGQTVTLRQVYKVHSKNSYSFELHGPNPQTGEEILMMQVKYTRME